MRIEVENLTAAAQPFAHTYRAENVELQAEDLILSAYEGDAVDLDELVREQILLALPSRHLCREDCKGLCQKCGANLNDAPCSCEQGEVDPRWAALADLKKDVNGEWFYSFQRRPIYRSTWITFKRHSPFTIHH